MRKKNYDSESGLYYYRFRMYDAQLGRFLQADPIGYYDSMNLYQYCGNNPINFVDPWGMVRIELLPQEEFYKRMRDPVRNIINSDARIVDKLWPFNYMTDSDFWDGGEPTNDILYFYASEYYWGSEINYYLQGILYEHYNLASLFDVWLPALWKFLNYREGVSDATLMFVQLGRMDYPKWKDCFKNE